ncbi:MAG TPA: hypothetical protein VFH68_18970 [Polyangia bacterium]|nr:hypothetical protein [Polyangia bacterium]
MSAPQQGGGSQLQLRGDDLDITYIERWVADLGLRELWRSAGEEGYD